MIRCTKCNYGWNPDTATSCVQCKTPLASAATPQRSDTLSEEAPKPESSRNATLVESAPLISKPVSSTPPSLPVASNAPPVGGGTSDIQRPPKLLDPSIGGPSIGGDTGDRRRTVFAGSAPSGETPVAGFSSGQAPSVGRTPLANGPKRPQTIAVDPSRKIVGVLITYSWQESGQVFPVLEGRNLIGKDPDQCDICIPQDATLSAVNSFITYRKHFLIGDKVSMSGTDVDGEPIETEFVPLRNYAKIRTGSTYWTFVCIQPPASADDSNAS